MRALLLLLLGASAALAGPAPTSGTRRRTCSSSRSTTWDRPLPELRHSPPVRMPVMEQLISQGVTLTGLAMPSCSPTLRSSPKALPPPPRDPQQTGPATPTARPIRERSRATSSATAARWGSGTCGLRAPHHAPAVRIRAAPGLCTTSARAGTSTGALHEDRRGTRSSVRHDGHHHRRRPRGGSCPSPGSCTSTTTPSPLRPAPGPHTASRRRRRATAPCSRPWTRRSATPASVDLEETLVVVVGDSLLRPGQRRTRPWPPPREGARLYEERARAPSRARGGQGRSEALISIVDLHRTLVNWRTAPSRARTRSASSPADPQAPGATRGCSPRRTTTAPARGRPVPATSARSATPLEAAAEQLRGRVLRPLHRPGREQYLAPPLGEGQAAYDSLQLALQGFLWAALSAAGRRANRGPRPARSPRARGRQDARPGRRGAAGPG